jgi:hypothetical protein
MIERQHARERWNLVQDQNREAVQLSMVETSAAHVILFPRLMGVSCHQDFSSHSALQLDVLS